MSFGANRKEKGPYSLTPPPPPSRQPPSPPLSTALHPTFWNGRARQLIREQFESRAHLVINVEMIITGALGEAGPSGLQRSHEKGTVPAPPQRNFSLFPREWCTFGCAHGV